MKFTFSLLLFVLFLYSCNQNDSGQIQSTDNSKIIVDTLTINIKGMLEQSIKYKNNYYCFFSKDNPYSSMDELSFYIISETGKIKKEIFVPDEIQKLYLDLHIRNDSILVKDYYTHRTFYLDRIKFKFIEIEETDDRVFEDEDFYVTSLDFGEWGGTLWFKDKKTGYEYETYSSEPVINKFNDIYYVTLSKYIFEIEDPLKLKKCDPDYYYKTVEEKKWHLGSYYLEGVNIIYKDTLLFYDDTGIYIATSFIFNNELKHLCVDNGIAYIAHLKEGKMMPTDTICEDMFIYRHSNTYRRNLYKSNKQLWHFATTNREVFGFIEIDEDQIKIHYINNLDTAKYLGTNTANLAFIELFDYITENIGELNLEDIKEIELKLGATDVTPRHKMSIGEDFYPNKNKFIIESPKAYKKIEDTTLTLLTNYYYTENNNSIKVCSFKWTKTHENAYGIYASDDEKIQIENFKNRFYKLRKVIEDKYGEPIKISKTNYGTYLRWQPDSILNIYLSSSNLDRYRNVEMRIFGE